MYSNAGPTLSTGIKSRKKEHLITYNTLMKAGINPILHWIDNEFSTDLIEER